MMLLLTVRQGTSPAMPVHLVSITQRISRSFNHEALNPVFAVALEDSQRQYSRLLYNASWLMEVIDDTPAEPSSLYPVLLTLAKLYREKPVADAPTVIFAPGTIELLNLTMSRILETKN